MAKRFKGGIKEDIVKEVEEIAQRVAEEKIEIEEIDETKEVEEAEVVLSFGKMPKEAPTVQFIS